MSELEQTVCDCGARFATFADYRTHIRGHGARGGEIERHTPDPGSVPARLSDGYATGGPIIGNRVVRLLDGCIIRPLRDEGVAGDV